MSNKLFGLLAHVCWKTIPLMRPHSRSGRKWRRFIRRQRVNILVAVIVLVVIALVAVLTYVLTSPDYRVRWGS